MPKFSNLQAIMTVLLCWAILPKWLHCNLQLSFLLPTILHNLTFAFAEGAAY